jgi:hypothetical protein
MSVGLLNLAQRKRLGSAARKAVMQFCAWKADDDGTEVFASKETIAQATELDRSTVIRTINAFVAEGLLHPAGKRRCSTGYTTKYAIDVTALERLEDQAALMPWHDRAAASNAAAKESHGATPCPEPTPLPAAASVDNPAKGSHGAIPPVARGHPTKWHGATQKTPERLWKNSC